METKQSIFSDTNKLLDSLSIKVESVDDNRPWGGFFVVDEKSAKGFIDHFFPEIDKMELQK